MTIEAIYKNYLHYAEQYVYHANFLNYKYRDDKYEARSATLQTHYNQINQFTVADKQVNVKITDNDMLKRIQAMLTVFADDYWKTFVDEIDKDEFETQLIFIMSYPVASEDAINTLTAFEKRFEDIVKSLMSLGFATLPGSQTVPVRSNPAVNNNNNNNNSLANHSIEPTPAQLKELLKSPRMKPEHSQGVLELSPKMGKKKREKKPATSEAVRNWYNLNNPPEEGPLPQSPKQSSRTRVTFAFDLSSSSSASVSSAASPNVGEKTLLRSALKKQLSDVVQTMTPIVNDSFFVAVIKALKSADKGDYTIESLRAEIVSYFIDDISKYRRPDETDDVFEGDVFQIMQQGTTLSQLMAERVMTGLADYLNIYICIKDTQTGQKISYGSQFSNKGTIELVYHSNENEKRFSTSSPTPQESCDDDDDEFYDCDTEYTININHRLK